MFVLGAPIEYGCTDSLQACNYDPVASADTGCANTVACIVVKEQLR